MAKKRRPRGAGSTRQLASGRWQARFRGPDGVMRPAPRTFDTRLDAEAWLTGQERDVERGLWTPPEEASQRHGLTLRQYAETWLANRQLTPRTRQVYSDLLRIHILPKLGDAQLDRITPTTVRNWYSSLSDDKPTAKSHAYALLRAIYNTAVSDTVISGTNPCRITSTGHGKLAHERVPATLAELEVIVTTMPQKWRLMVLLAAWCGLRWGEITELRRADFDLLNGVVRIRRGATRVKGAWHIGSPKTAAGVRAVTIPPHLMPAVEDHLETIPAANDSLLFPAKKGGTLSPSTFQTEWFKARAAAGRPDLRFHDLRHTGATLAAATGATLKELMVRLGHATPDAAMRYQHAALERDKAIAEALSGFASAKVVALRPAKASGASGKRTAKRA